jgi:hypothetical protein
MADDEHPSSIYASSTISYLSSNLPIKLISSGAVKLNRNQIPTDWRVHHEANARHSCIIEYLTGNTLHSFHRHPFVPTKSYDFPPILLFDGWIPMLFQLLTELYHDSSIFDSTVGTSVASMDLGISFLVFLCITLLVTISYTFCFTGFYISEAF